MTLPPELEWLTWPIPLMVLFVLFACTVSYLVGRIWVNQKTFEKFKINNPDSFRDNKFIACPSCYGDYIYVKSIGGRMNSHICKQCGKELWRSKS